MSTELVTYQPQNTLTEKMEWSRAMAPASLLPKQYRDNPGNLLYAVEYADALGIERINAITSIHVIEGKPSASADLIAGMIRRAGHKLRVVGDDTYAEAHLIRADDPEFTYVARWDLDKARQAGLLGKGTWKNYPGALLRSRAITEVGRMGASDALLGVVYTPEELGAEVNAQGEPIHQTPIQQSPAATGRDRMRQVLGKSEPAAEDAPEPAAPADDIVTPSSPASITSAQLKKLHVLLPKVGLTDRDRALSYYTNLVGRPIESSKDLSKNEATQVIDDLSGMEANGAQVEDIHDAELVDEPALDWPEGGGQA